MFKTKYIARSILIMATMINVIAFSIVSFGIDYSQEEYEITEYSIVEKNVQYSATPEMIDACLKEYDSRKLDQGVELISYKEPISNDITYTIENGDSLWSIANRFYGDGSYYPFIMKKNNITGNIHPGDIITIYHIDDKESILEECYKYTREENRKKASTSVSSSYSGKARNGIIPNSDDLTFIGNFRITGYDAYCAHCCGKTNGITASGTHAKVGRTVAAKGIPFGTKLYIEGYGTYTVEDRGGFNPNLIDIVASSHEECYTLTANNVPVYRVN